MGLVFDKYVFEKEQKTPKISVFLGKNMSCCLRCKKNVLNSNRDRQV